MFSHIKVIFLPKNTTSRLQPLDAGIIKNFKVIYKKKIVSHALSQIQSSSLTATEINKQVDVLTAIRWIKHSWEQVKESTIQHCFRHCGFRYVPVPAGDPFSDLDEDTTVLELQPDGMSAVDYVSAEEDVPTSQSFEDDDNW